jgi:hypothetical protein
MAKKIATAATVEDINESEVSTGRKERNRKPSFDLNTAVDNEGNLIALNEDGQLTGMPANWTPDKSNLKRGEFAENSMFYQFRINAVIAGISKMQDKVKELEDKRDGKEDPVAKKQKQLERLKKRVAALESDLGEAIAD